MRTGIYVQKCTTVTIRASAPEDARVQLRRLRPPVPEAAAIAHMREPDAVGTHQLDAGIYLIVSSKPMQVEGTGLTTQIMANNKDPWPDPELTVVGLVPGATPEAVQDFFSVAKGLEVGGASVQPESTEPITKITDDPDGL
jgi:hypothetical protein